MEGASTALELPHLTAVTLALTAVFMDLSQGIIPNGLTVSGAVAGLVFNVLTHGLVEGVRNALGGMGLGLGLMLPLFLLGGMGGGDIKLLASIGAWVGPPQVFCIIVYGSFVGGLACLYLLIRTNRLSALNRLGADVRLFMKIRTRLEPKEDSLTIPYSLPIAAGTILGTFLGNCL